MSRFTTIAASVALVAATGLAFAAAHGGNPEVSARKAHMGLQGFNLYYLLGVAGGKADYDAETAQGAADNLVALSNINQMRYWPAGSDNGTLGDATRALPALWENFPDVMTKVGAVKEAALALQGAAGNGLDAMAPAAKALNDACNACHKAYRASNS